MVVPVVTAARARTGTPRRTVLRGAGALAGLAAAGTLGAGCARPEGPDPLEEPLAAARDDAVTAAAAAAAYPELAGRLTPLSRARRAHADTLAAEIRRARPDRTATVDTAATPAPARPAASAAAAVTALRRSLGTARDGAGALALTVEASRCGLLTSVAASCAGYVTVLG
ncbi:hypothetical protein [Actinomycetospora sp. NBC_00405]|uniref:hypothetical protein n=1 Tax=Actinomycetospora sp. NBC_00405 TaxID=2975952 RepID=UPI002E23082F